jgi:hypothetical protein
MELYALPAIAPSALAHDALLLGQPDAVRVRHGWARLAGWMRRTTSARRSLGAGTSSLTDRRAVRAPSS